MDVEMKINWNTIWMFRTNRQPHEYCFVPVNQRYNVHLCVCACAPPPLFLQTFSRLNSAPIVPLYNYINYLLHLLDYSISAEVANNVH